MICVLRLLRGRLHCTTSRRPPSAGRGAQKLRTTSIHFSSCCFPACCVLCMRMCAAEHAEPQARYTAFLEEVARRTGRLVGLWQALGFVHGVLNTDNM